MPNRINLDDLLGLGSSQTSFISILDFLYLTWNDLFTAFHRNNWLADAKWQEGCQTVVQRCPVPNVLGFVDASWMCRPKRNQHMWYRGQKHSHVMKFQPVMSLFRIRIHTCLVRLKAGRTTPVMRYSSNPLQQIRLISPQSIKWCVTVCSGDTVYLVKTGLFMPFQS